MLILTIRTDNPEAEVGLFDGQKQIGYHTWKAHRELATTLHSKLREFLKANNVTLNQIEGIGVFKGPGSFTGLRIGITVANALADGFGIAIVGASGADWLEKVCSQLVSGKNEHSIHPEYGAEPHTTQPKH